MGWEMEQMYQLSKDKILDYGGRGLLAVYSNSPAGLLLAAYPSHSWQVWKFDKVPNRWWQDTANQKKYMESVRKQLNIKAMEDFYRLSKDDLTAAGGALLLRRPILNWCNFLSPRPSFTQNI